MMGMDKLAACLKVIFFLLVLKCCISVLFLTGMLPGISDRVVQASQEQKVPKTAQKNTDSLDATKTFEEGACHPELITLLRLQKAKLDEREKLLNSRKQDLEILERDIDEKIKALKELQKRLEGPVKKKQYEEQARLQHLAGVYSSMDPVRAASLLDKMDVETVTKLFAIMKSKKVANILANMSPDKAARISSSLYNGNPVSEDN